MKLRIGMSLTCLTALAGLAAGQSMQTAGLPGTARMSPQQVPSGEPEILVLDTSVGAPWDSLAPADVDDQGRVVGQASLTGGGTSGYEWTPSGGLALINSPFNGVGRINSNGDMAYPINPLVLADGTHVYSENLFANTSGVKLNDLNDDLLVVGRAPGSGTTSNILVWDPVQGSRSYFVAAARGLDRVNQNTLAVGSAIVNTTGSDGFVIDLATGVSTRFNAILPAGPTTWSVATDVNELGQVVGEGSDGSSLAAFVWAPNQGFTFLPGLKGGEAIRVHPRAIDNSGRVVGMAMIGGPGFEWRAFLWDPDLGMLDLNDLVETPNGYLMREAEDISETGVVIGWGDFPTGALPQPGFIVDSI